MTQVLGLITNDTFGYKLLLAIHVLAVIGAFGPLMTSGPLNRLAASKSGDEARSIAEVPLRTAKAISMPPFIVAVLAGIGLVLASNDVFSFSQQWISLAFSLGLVIVLVYLFLLIPAQKMLVDAVHNGSDAVRSATAKSAAATGLIHMCMVLLIIDMIWKPGL